jgi:hypothetical protein
MSNAEWRKRVIRQLLILHSIFCIPHSNKKAPGLRPEAWQFPGNDSASSERAFFQAVIPPAKKVGKARAEEGHGLIYTTDNSRVNRNAIGRDREGAKVREE